MTLGELRAMAAANVRRHLRGYAPPGDPVLDAGGLALFTRSLAGAKVYLEYGSGGTTVAAARIAQHVMAVDNDAVFLRAVARATRGTRATCYFMPMTTGMIRQWGHPVFTRPTAARRRRWRRYVEAPWAELRKLALEPDVCLIDGRFRVACVLFTLLASRAPALLLLVDDFNDREFYREVETHAEIVESSGRMVSLRRRSDFDETKCRAAFEQFLLDPR